LLDLEAFLSYFTRIISVSVVSFVSVSVN